MEDRRLLSATFTVSNTNDAGSGSLRQALIDVTSYDATHARNALYPNVIAFRIGTGTRTIAPKSPLPSVPYATLVDGSTQGGFAGRPLIVLDGAGAGSSANGLQLGGSCTVQDLVIEGFARSGLVLGGSGRNLVQGDYIGTDATGKLRRANQVGVTVTSNWNDIGALFGQNVISGNSLYGVDIAGSSADNVLTNNLIGTDRTGEAKLGNGEGVYLSGTASHNQIGITDSLYPTSLRNVISGNVTSGIVIDPGAAGNAVANTFIGTDSKGETALRQREGRGPGPWPR